VGSPTDVNCSLKTCNAPWSSRNHCYGRRADERGERSQGGREGCWAGARNLQQREERKIREQTGHESRRKSQRECSGLGEGLRHSSPHRPVSEGELRKARWQGTTLGKLPLHTRAFHALSNDTWGDADDRASQEPCLAWVAAVRRELRRREHIAVLGFALGQCISAERIEVDIPDGAWEFLC
jgi:hypothetical protein